MRTVRWRHVVVALGLVLGGCGGGVDGDATGPRTDGADMARQIVAYGEQPDQTLEVFRPEGGAWADVPVVVLIHGGFWKENFRADLMVPLAIDLAARGITAVNLEYARVGGAGGWPRTLSDVAAAIDALADEDLVGDVAAAVADRGVITVGHSAGGHLAVWAASRANIPAATVVEVGGFPVVQPCAVVSQAGVVDFDDATRLGGGAVADLLGGDRSSVPDRWDAADPVSLLPIGVPVTLVHGEGDAIVPLSQSERYAARAREAGDDATVVPVPGDHFVNIDVSTEAWAAVVAAVEAATC